MRWRRPSDIGFVVLRNVQIAALFAEKALIRLKHHLIRHLPVTPSPQWGRQKALAFARAQKINILQSASPYISLAQQYQIQGDSLRGARGFKRGEAPLPMGESGGPWVGPPAAFSPFVPVQMAYISRLYRKASYNKAEKEISTYNTEHSSDRITTSSERSAPTFPSRGRQCVASFSLRILSDISAFCSTITRRFFRTKTLIRTKRIGFSLEGSRTRSVHALPAADESS